MLICGVMMWSYVEFDWIVDCLCNGLCVWGIVRGDCVVVVVCNSYVFMVLCFVVVCVGVLFVLINFMFNVEDMCYIFDYLGVWLLFVDEIIEVVVCVVVFGVVEVIYGLLGEWVELFVVLLVWIDLFGDDVLVEDVVDVEDLF